MEGEIKLSHAALLRMMALELHKAANVSEGNNKQIVTMSVVGARDWANWLGKIADELDKE